MIINRVWAMPSKNTFEVKPIGDFVLRRIRGFHDSVDPFARNNLWATKRNDLNPETAATYHMDARDFLDLMFKENQSFEVAIFDPLYSPRQITECYNSMGKKATMQDTQNARLYSECRDKIDAVMRLGGIVLSFGWNSSGMGKTRGYELEEILIVCHGAAHNDTICMCERKI